MCPGQLCYFDMAYNNSTYERGICWAATIETSDIHAWQPLNNIDPKYHSFSCWCTRSIMVRNIDSGSTILIQ